MKQGKTVKIGTNSNSHTPL